ncbi:MAG: hypothetical protein K9M45_09275 [Kiritimatiellales bacterium]|nr:hypothetical protein [Kiritimatiellales bacterium]
MFKVTGGIIKAEMTGRGYKHRSVEDQFSIRGQYARNLQFAYSKEMPSASGLIADLVYFAVDIHSEKLIIGLFRENTDIENGVMVNASRSLSLGDFSQETVARELDKLIPRIWHEL